jgi:hypothetical protein
MPNMSTKKSNNNARLSQTLRSSSIKAKKPLDDTSAQGSIATKSVGTQQSAVSQVSQLSAVSQTSIGTHTSHKSAVTNRSRGTHKSNRSSGTASTADLNHDSFSSRLQGSSILETETRLPTRTLSAPSVPGIRVVKGQRSRKERSNDTAYFTDEELLDGDCFLDKSSSHTNAFRDRSAEPFIDSFTTPDAMKRKLRGDRHQPPPPMEHENEDYGVYSPSTLSSRRSASTGTLPEKVSKATKERSSKSLNALKKAKKGKDVRESSSERQKRRAKKKRRKERQESGRTLRDHNPDVNQESRRSRSHDSHLRSSDDEPRIPRDDEQALVQKLVASTPCSIRTSQVFENIYAVRPLEGLVEDLERALHIGKQALVFRDQKGLNEDRNRIKLQTDLQRAALLPPVSVVPTVPVMAHAEKKPAAQKGGVFRQMLRTISFRPPSFASRGRSADAGTLRRSGSVRPVGNTQHLGGRMRRTNSTPSMASTVDLDNMDERIG